jgi:antitoxin ParD1/3/4
MNVSITDSLQTFVQEQVNTGLYSSASEVVRAGLRLLREREAAINNGIKLSLEQIEKGEFVEVKDEFWNSLDLRVEQRVLSFNEKSNV